MTEHNGVMNPPLLAQIGTRERILAYLEENRTATVVALSHAWGLTRADIRYHMNQLIAEGLVERATAVRTTATGTAKSPPRGRPTVAYRLTARSTPDNFARLSHALLELMLDSVDESEREDMLRKIATKLADGVPPSARITSARFNQAVEMLNQQSYRARWEASPAGPRFLLRACPYAALLDHHPALCQMDQHLLETLTGLPLRQSARVGSGSGNALPCVFLPR